jgi:hypothetical protein
MMKPAVHISEMHDNMEKALIDAESMKCTYSRKIYRRFEKERGMSITSPWQKTTV